MPVGIDQRQPRAFPRLRFRPLAKGGSGGVIRHAHSCYLPMLTRTKDLDLDHFRNSIEVVINLRIQEPENLDLPPGSHPPFPPFARGGERKAARSR